MTAVQSEIDTKVQRGIEARYLPTARADRLQAQAASLAARQPAPSTVRWNSRPTKADRQRDEAAAAERQVREKRLTDGDRHLRAAEVERAGRWDHKRHATPATMEAANENAVCVSARTRSGALARLHATGAIDTRQLESAVDIASVAEAIARDVTTKAASYETRIDSGRHGGEAEEKLGQVRREVAYKRWCAAVRGPLGAVLEMIVGDTIGYSVVARRFGMTAPRAKRVLIDALDLWPAMIGAVCREIDQADLDRAIAHLA